MHIYQFASSLALFVLSRDRHSQTNGGLSSSSTLPASDTMTAAARYAALLQWLRSNDADISPKIDLQPSSRGGGYGAFLTEDAVEGELLFTIPRKTCITLADSIEDDACGEGFKALIETAGPGGNTVVMAGFMARERIRSLESQKPGSIVDDSSFGPYLATLPWERGMNNQEHVLYWDNKDIEKYLKGSMCYGEALDLRKEVDVAIRVLNTIVGKSIREFRGDYLDSGFQWPWEKAAQASEEKLKGPPEGLAEAVKGAFVCMLTRAFEDGDGDEEKLVPMLDMLQHSDEPNISHAMRKSDGAVEVRARQDLTAGQELLNQYRSELEETMPYHRFFTRFGFVPGIQEEMTNLFEDKSSIFFAQKAEI
jgi:hypothetical protein